MCFGMNASHLFFIKGKGKFWKWGHKFEVGESEGKREEGNSKFKGGGGVKPSADQNLLGLPKC